MNPLRAPRGFTLIELLVTIAVLAIIIALAIPSFEGVLTRAKLRAVANDLAAGAYLARSEAIKRNAVVRLCSSSDASTCSGNWDNGWIVLAGTTVVQVSSPLPTGFKILSTGSINNLAFQAAGFGATAATLTVCRATPTVGPEERVVTVDLSGRADVKRTQAGSCA